MKIVKFKINGLNQRDFDATPFGRRIEMYRAIDQFKKSAKSTWVSMKRKSAGTAIKDAVRLLGASEKKSGMTHLSSFTRREKRGATR